MVFTLAHLVVCFLVCAGFSNSLAKESDVGGKGCNCPDYYNPVCGDDGKTYENNCRAQCAKVKVVKKGACGQDGTEPTKPAKPSPSPPPPSPPPPPPPPPSPSVDCVCILIFDPVCGEDGKTYENSCFAACAGVKVVSEGECGKSPPTDKCICGADYQPVCGSDGETYGNECMARCAKVKVESHGECIPKQPCKCSKEYDPVCGDNGQTYSNKCLAECAGVKVAKQGECKGHGAGGQCYKYCHDFSKCGEKDFMPCVSHCQRSYKKPACCGSDGCSGGKKCVYGKCV